jgi:hypothetical protein
MPPEDSLAVSTQSPLGLLWLLFRQTAAESIEAGMPLWARSIVHSLQPSTTDRTFSRVRSDDTFASAE